MPCFWERPDSLHRILRSLRLEDLNTDLKDFQDVRKVGDIHYCEDAEDNHNCEDVQALQVCLVPYDNLGHKKVMLRLLSCVNMR
jgi:hypothetical protein